jgi:uncharacterized delta-60 repeat protein
MVWRLKTDGALDPGFDTDGAALVDSGGYASGAAVRMQPDGKILLAGGAKVGTNPFAAAVWRLAPNGGAGVINDALDSTFGGDGVVRHPSSVPWEARAVAVLPDHRVVAVNGYVSGPNLVVLKAQGGLDSGYSADGEGVGPLDGAIGRRLVVLGDGKVVVIGSDSDLWKGNLRSRPTVPCSRMAIPQRHAS